jgi:amidohydrolase
MEESGYLGYITALRRKFHKIPELAFNEFETQKEIISELEKTGINYRKAGTGIIAEIDAGKGHTIAFRADMDALPITESNDVPYKSARPGFMHACGHDGHMALLLGFIHWCKHNIHKMESNAVFIFQPAEEGEGGAVRMIEAGALEDVDEIYAVHVDPDVKEGEAGLKEGVFMAGDYELDIVVKGYSCHCAQKISGRDALHALTGIIEGIYKNLPQSESLFHCGKISAGYARNVVADSAVANCTIRYFKEKDLNNILDVINAETEIARAKYGVSCTINALSNYIPLVNHPQACQKVEKYIKCLRLPLRFTAEDFAFYLKNVKGCLVWLGVGGTAVKKLHSPDFDFDEKALMYGLKLYQNIIEEKING